MSDKLLAKHQFVFNKHDGGGEALWLTTKVYSNGDPGGIYLNQDLVLQSYCNSATFNLVGAQVTPELLRELANQLDEVIARVKVEVS